MKFTFCKLLPVFLILSVTSCLKPPCNCDPLPFKYLKVKIVNQQGQNLLFGTSALYNPDSIKILEQSNNLSVTNAFVSKLISDSTILFDFIKPSEKNYIYYNQQTSLDSLQIKWRTKTGKCCGEKYTFYEVDSVKFNTGSMKPINGSFILIK